VAKVLAALHAQEYFDAQGLVGAVLVAVVAAVRAVAVVAAVRAVFEEDLANSYFTFFRHIKFFCG